MVRCKELGGTTTQRTPWYVRRRTDAVGSTRHPPLLASNRGCGSVPRSATSSPSEGLGRGAPADGRPPPPQLILGRRLPRAEGEREPLALETDRHLAALLEPAEEHLVGQ